MQKITIKEGGNVSGTTSFSNNAIQNANDLSGVNKHNLRDYDNQRELITTIYGTNNIVQDVKQVYLDEEYKSTLINFGKYKLVMFAMAKLMEMKTIEQNKVALYLFNIIEC